MWYFGNNWYFGKNSTATDAFADKPHWTTRCQDRLIRPECYTLHLSTVLESMVLNSPNFAWSARYLQTEWNFLKHLVIVINCAFTTRTTNFFGCFCDVINQFEFIMYKLPNLSPLHVHQWNFQMERNRAQRTSAPTTMPLPTSVGTFYDLNCWCNSRTLN